ncbi:uncharacterized protein LOC133197467 [Saccostrea echinata]|uniref:uncharacterized protein LOC133197467 n=1 Tax=Saccostrea echinata TaxID=191078 RepID=UPI002A803D5E|nr:uncharacterized protein LOC133197467 [Saccostrea echinata]
MNGGASRRPTEQDREVVKNMTEWIQNDTIRFYIQSHLLFCPGQDMCFGNQYKRNYTAILPFPSCFQCECRYECKRKNNCCPWRNYKQDVEMTPDYISYMDNNQFTPSKYINVPQQCIAPQVNYQSVKRSIKAYFMISQCPFNYTDSNTHQRCNNPLQEKDMYLYQPVFSPFSNESFKNLDCAICNGESLSNLVPWTPILVCSSRKTLIQTQSLDQLQSVAFQKNSLCNVIFVPQTSTFTRDCFSEKLYISNCNETGEWKIFDSIIFNACHSDFVYVYLECSTAFERRVFKNIFCAMCNFHDWDSSLGIECVSSVEVYDLKNPFSLVSFSALIDFRANEDVPTPSEGTKCSKDSLRFVYMDTNLGYSLSTCYISHPYLNLYTFLIPIALMITLNMFMFFIIVREIRTKKNNPISNTNEKQMMKIYFKLSTLTGSSWLLGFLHQIFQLQILSFLHIIFTGSQGLFLFFSFGLPLLLGRCQKTT